MSFLSLVTLASDSGLSAKDIGMLIGIVLGPTGIAGVFKWMDKGKDAENTTLREELKRKDTEIAAIKEEAHARNQELINELRTVLPKLEQNTVAIQSSNETMTRVVEWMEASSRLNKEEIEAFGEIKKTMQESRDALIAFAAKYLDDR